MDKRALIDTIRTKRYKVGDDSSNEIKEELNSTLEILAKELYAKDTHFVLELLQNADDNKYDEGITPEIIFSVQNQVLTIRNNEIGFAPENVDSICRAGKSTKKQEKKLGYIGEKGIGFKSVFKVSDSPQIHSNGFHFHFKTADEKDVLGFVVPHWIDNPPVSCTGDGTTIILPAKNGYQFEKRHFQAIKPELLLFLRRLRAIGIFTDWDGRTVNVRRRDEGDSIRIEVKARLGTRTDEKTDFYKIAKFQADVTGVDVKEREGFESSEIVLAFPLTVEGLPDFGSSRYAFAFLPIRNYGLKFVLHADFLLTSNREDIQDNNPWNESLLEQVSTAFVQQALPMFKQDAELRTRFYGYLEYKRLDELFEPLMKMTYAGIGKSECILTADNNWRTPYDVLIGDAACKELLGNEELLELLGKEFVAKEIHSFREVLAKLGCEDFSIEHMIVCLSDVSWVAGHREDPAWFGRLYSYLSLNAKSEKQLDSLRDLKIFPVTNGSIMSLKDGNIFFPLKGESYGFEDSLTVLVETVLPKPDAPSRQRVVEFLNRLGISKAEPKYIIDKHILSEHKSADNRANEKAYIGHIRYIKDNLEAYLSGDPSDGSPDTLRNRLGATLYLLTTGTTEYVYAHAANMYLGKEYRNSNDLEILFSGNAGIQFVSSAYLNDPKDPAECAKWFDFFKSIGVKYIPKLTTIVPNIAYLGISKRSTKQISGTDFDLSSELQELFVTDRRNIKNHLLSIIARNWSYYSQFAEAKIAGYYYGTWNEKTPSTFIRKLKALQVPVANNGFQVLQKTYIDNNDARAYFGSDLPFLESDVAGYLPFLDAVNITYKVTLKAALERLKSLSEGRGEFTKDSLSRLYKLIELSPSTIPGEVRKFFSQNSLIYVQKHERHWLKSGEVCWKEPANKIISSRYPAIRGEYREHETFFLGMVGIQERLSAGKLIEVLKSLNADPSDNAEKANAAQKIYLGLEEFLKEAESNEEGAPDWLDQFSEECLLWTAKNELHINENDVFINDVPTIGEIFKDCDNFTFLAIDYNHIPRLELFIKANQLTFLSKALVRSLPHGTVKKPLPQITRIINERWRYIAQHFYTCNYKIFQRLLDSERLIQLSRAEVFSVRDLKLKLKLVDQEATTPYRCAVIDGFIIVDENLSGNLELLFYEVSKELAKTLDDPNSSAFINLILEATSQDMIDLRVQELMELPDDIEKLLVGEPAPEEEEEPPNISSDPVDGNELLPDSEAGQDETSEETSVDISSGGLGTTSAQEDERAPHSGSQNNNDDAGIPVKTAVAVPDGDGRAPTPETENVWRDKKTELGNRTGHRPSPAGFPGADQAGTSDDEPAPDDFDEPPTPSSHDRNSFRGGETKEWAAGEPTTSAKNEGNGERLKGTLTLDKIKNKSYQGLSYVGHDKSEQEPKDPARRERDMAISTAAVDIVKASEEKAGFIVDFVSEGEDHNNPGYDVHSVSGSEERYIEVKGTDGPWTAYGVSISPTQLDCAKINRDNFWLYVVEHARTPHAKLYRIKNPYEKITHFRFDSGWKSFAEAGSEDTKQELKLGEGLRITLKQLNQSGEITVVKGFGNGKLFKLCIKLDSGKTIKDMLFNPATMILESK